MRFAVVAALLPILPGCGGCGEEHARVDAASRDSEVVDQLESDAVSIDAVSIDAPPVENDPACAGTSPSCTTTPALILPVSEPNYVANMVHVDEMLYVSTYEIANNGSPYVAAGQITAIDLTSGSSSVLLPATVSYTLSAANGWAFAAEDAASATIWRFRPGVAPEALVTGVARPVAVSADATHVYWSQHEGSVDVIKRRLITGGTVEPVMECNSASVLVLDDTYVYCSQFGQNLFRATKAGTGATSIAGSTYPYTGMIKCASNLYATNVGQKVIDKVPMPNGPNATFATVPGIGRFYGIAATQDHFYVTTADLALYRISRADSTYVNVVTDADARAAPVTWNGQLVYWQFGEGVKRCVD